MSDDIIRKSIKYCMVLKKTNNREKAVRKIGRALMDCDGVDEDIKMAKMLLEALL